MYFSLGQYCDRAQLILQQKIRNWVHQNCTAIQPGPDTGGTNFERTLQFATNGTDRTARHGDNGGAHPGQVYNPPATSTTGAYALLAHRASGTWAGLVIGPREHCTTPARECAEAGPRMCAGRPENVCKPARECVQAGPRMCAGRPENVCRPGRLCKISASPSRPRNGQNALHCRSKTRSFFILIKNSISVIFLAFFVPPEDVYRPARGCVQAGPRM